MVKNCFLLLCIAALSSSLLHAQQRDELRLISSSHSRLNASTGNMMNYRPVYEHHGSTLSADSGYIHSDDAGRQFFDAFGKVIITQPNGTVIYADKLHYVAETQLATLTNNVRMVDGNSVLTTNYLTYNMKSSVGTYTGGGRIVNVTDTITSRNAYYFDQTKDAYFRYDVIVRTPDVKIYTDTMRYNSATKMTYFYGPTNIKGNEGENLYTERGEYNTNTKQAWFDRNNLYTSGSRVLRGDSLFYDGESGNGRAVQNVVFIDTADQFFAFGGVGLYHRVDESITMTVNPLVMTVTRNDTTDTDTVAGGTMPVDSIATSHGSTQADSVGGTLPTDSIGKPIASKPALDTIYMTADTLFSQVILLKDYIPKVFELNREGGEIIDYEDQDYGEDPSDEPGGPPVDMDSLFPDSLGTDSLGVPPTDSLETPPDSSDFPEPTRETKADSVAASLAGKTDAAVLKTHLKRVEATPLAAQLGHDALARNLAADSVLRERAVIPSGGEADSLLAGAIASLSRPPTDTLPQDSLAHDTATTRIIKAHYNVRLFKSDLQAVADSVYYGYPDSMMRFFGHPMIWAQGSQLNADTIFMQIRNEQMDNMLLVGNAFMVNTQLDSVKYNQVKGRKITGFFRGNALERIFVDGNAESIYYLVDEKRKAYSDMYHSRSSRIKILVDSNAITHFIPIRNIDGKIYPLTLVPREAEILDGFVWKPTDRPISKEDLMTRRRPPAGVDLVVPNDSLATDSTQRGSLPSLPDKLPRDSSGTDSMQRQAIAPIPENNKPDSSVIDSMRRQRLGPVVDSLGRDSITVDSVRRQHAVPDSLSTPDSTTTPKPPADPGIEAVPTGAQEQDGHVPGKESGRQLVLFKQVPIVHRYHDYHRHQQWYGGQAGE